jgi:GNAT superfamily N-acetyltransferase
VSHAIESNAGREAGVRISSDPDDLQLDWLVPALSERAYWAKGRSREMIEGSIRGSLCFGAFDTETGRQIGFARVVTDEATFGWVCDVFVDESVRGRGTGKALLSAIVAEPRLATCRLQLATRDATGLYLQFGFQALRNPDRQMERFAG